MTDAPAPSAPGPAGTGRVLVMGAGAIGGYFGACLSRAGHDVTFVARGANFEAMQQGVRVTGAMGDFDVPERWPISLTDDPRTSTDNNLVLLCVKNYDLADAAAAVADSGRLFLTLQNGVDAPGVARDVLGDRVIAGTTGIVCDLPEPGHVHVTSSYAWIRFGEPGGPGPDEASGTASGGEVSDRVHGVASMLGVPGIEPMPVPDARVSLWEKMTLMCGMAGLTTLHQRPMGEILGDPATKAEFEGVLAECATVAQANGVPLPDDFLAQRIAYAERIDPAAMSSMSRDFARGRRIELETFNGAIVRMGAELGIDVPANRAVYDAIRAKLPA